MPYVGYLAGREKFSGVVKLYLDRRYLDIVRQNAAGADLREVAEACDLPDLLALLGEIEPNSTAPLVPAEHQGELLELERAAQESQLPPLNFLAQCWRLDLRGRTDAAEAAQRLRALPGVEEAYPEAAVHGPGARVDELDAFDTQPGYLQPGPIGIGAAAQGFEFPVAEGAQVRLVDLESAWLLDHDGLTGRTIPLLAGDPDTDEGAMSHGTSVLGILVATYAALGDLGRSSDTSLGVASHYRDSHGQESGGGGHVAATIVELLVRRRIGPADVLLVEAQRSWLPVELDRADRDAIRLASALGVCVIEPAGNFGADLDDLPELGVDHRLTRDESTDSGAIIVGAARSEPAKRTRYKSNFGSRVDCFAWGENIAAPGAHVPPLKATSTTRTFGKTSGAAAVIAGAAVIVQHMALRTRGFPLTPGELRKVLSNPETGSTLPGERVGVMPDLEQIGHAFGA